MLRPICSTLALLAGLTAVASSQALNPPQPARLAQQPEPLNDNAPGLRATINGYAITAHDVLVEARAQMLVQGAPAEAVEDPPEIELKKALASFAREILLATEAQRLGMKISEFELDELLRTFFGELPDLEQIAQLTGTTADFQRERYRRQLTAMLYTRHRLGLDFRYSHLIPADPRLKRLVEVRPAELKREFERRREQLALPPRVHYLIHAFDDRDSAARGIEALEHGRESIGQRPPIDETLPLDVLPERFGGLPLAEWVPQAPAGAVSDAVVISAPPDLNTAGQGPLLEKTLFLVVQILERLPARPADFARDQDLLKRTLENENTERARQALVLDEARKAVVWPPELFSVP